MEQLRHARVHAPLLLLRFAHSHARDDVPLNAFSEGKWRLLVKLSISSGTQLSISRIR